MTETEARGQGGVRGLFCCVWVEFFLFLFGCMGRCNKKAGAEKGEGSVDMAGKGKMTRETAIRKLSELAMAPVNDAVKLAFLENGRGVEHLELTGLAEFRRTDKGGVEIKLVDRAAILRDLVMLTDERTGNKAEEFFRALGE